MKGIVKEMRPLNIKLNENNPHAFVPGMVVPAVCVRCGGTKELSKGKGGLRYWKYTINDRVCLHEWRVVSQ